MADPDPESEALMRKLHRELNGLARRSRQPRRADVANLLRSRQQAQTVSSTSSSSSSSETDTKSSGSKGSSGSGAGPEQKAGGPSTQRGTREAAGEKAKDARTDPTRRGAGGSKPQKRQRSIEDEGGQASREGRPPNQKAARTSGGDQQGTTHTLTPPLAPRIPLTPLEEAAVQAAALTRAKAKQAGASTRPGGGATVKCFHAGIRWGVGVSPSAIQRRTDLATVLNEAYAGLILSCGRGELLHVVFVDDQGDVCEFPPLQSDVRESTSKWKACADKAVRVYVMR